LLRDFLLAGSLKRNTKEAFDAKFQAFRSKNTQNPFFGLYTKPAQNESGAKKESQNRPFPPIPLPINLLATKLTTEGTKM